MSDISEARVMDVEERLRQAMMQHDLAALDALIAPDLLFTALDGALASKADDLAAHRAGLLRFERFEPVERQIQLHASFAVVSALMRLIGSYDGTPIDQRLRYTRVWSRSPDGGLHITAGHMSEVKTSA